VPPAPDAADSDSPPDAVEMQRHRLADVNRGWSEMHCNSGGFITPKERLIR